MTDVLAAITTALAAASTNFMAALEDVVPIALGIMAAVLVVRLAVRAFKALSK